MIVFVVVSIPESLPKSCMFPEETQKFLCLNPKPCSHIRPVGDPEVELGEVDLQLGAALHQHPRKKASLL